MISAYQCCQKEGVYSNHNRELEYISEGDEYH